MNSDGLLDASDLVLLANYLAGNIAILSLAGDLNGDGEINAADLVLLANILAGNIG